MATFDANLMLRNTTTTLSTNETGSWVTIGTGGGPVHGLSFRLTPPSTASANTATLSVILEFSDSTVAAESLRGGDLDFTGTAARAGTLGDRFVRAYTPRTFVRYRTTQSATQNENWGTPYIGIDAGDTKMSR